MLKLCAKVERKITEKIPELPDVGGLESDLRQLVTSRISEAQQDF